MINLRINYLNHRNSSIIHISITILMIVVISVFSTIIYNFDGRLKFDTFMVVCYVLTLIYSTVIIFQFTSAAISCRDRINAINGRIIIKSHQSSLEIRLCVELYRKIFLIIREVNMHLTMPLIPIFTFLFVAITFEFYAVVRAMYKNSEIKTFIAINASFWSFIELYPMIVTIYVAESTIESVEIIKKIGYEILCTQRIFDPQTEKIFDYFLKSIDKSKLRLKTMFYNLDWKLFFQVIFKLYNDIFN